MLLLRSRNLQQTLIWQIAHKPQKYSALQAHEVQVFVESRAKRRSQQKR